MDKGTSLPEIRGHRTLAAIVFTDGVSFSARMAKDEEHTLDLIRRDFTLMRELCSHYEGQVLKNTGDGLLMYFVSAVQAVGCAQEIQKALATAAKNLPDSEVLVHRIGIHLGDVFFSETDVMGNGVNIAARLQAEAEPGGICISQTVYDVVKNRLTLKVTYLGPRELKNIQEAIPVYQILLAAQPEVQERVAEPPLPNQYHASGETLSTTLPLVEAPALATVPVTVREQLKTLLVKLLGPIGPLVLAEGLRQAKTYDELIEILTLQLPGFQQEQFRAQVDALQTATSTELFITPETRVTLERALALAIGPMAALLLQQQLGQAQTLKELIDNLAQELPSHRESEFRALVEHLHHDNDTSTPAPVERSLQPAATDPTELNPTFIDQCQQELAVYIGPISRFVLEETITQFPDISPQHLVDTLASQIPNPHQANAFRQRFQS